MPRNNASASSQEDLIKEFQTLVSDTEKLLNTSANLVGEHADELREQIRSSLGRARSSLESTENGLRERGQAAVDATSDYVHSHPWHSLGIAAAIGLLFGMLITRR